MACGGSVVQEKKKEKGEKKGKREKELHVIVGKTTHSPSMKISSICKIRSRSIDNGCCSPPPRLLLAANAWSGRGRLVKLPTLAAARCHHTLLVAVGDDDCCSSPPCPLPAIMPSCSPSRLGWFAAT
uniref:Uncharacterized protein n=1 Tax=Oryza glumipatula TaxID=40148 RepID=A0A0E0AZE4_9ORYZ